ncbi:phosphopantetheine-binding protein [Streptomyces sp. MP131-18]|uniref:phosphopantetheine-binding protein n=1 Tax=Streptomyces sp. MP131-18 TaxID=1857892 RepID=UPI00097C475B|nr:phosphopantetheine-binding protein [Streptomyces sp. MP131-18]ONK14106.1 hypothetical protein STBA_48850 [Streptomyces sp. MP131-18]
MSVVQPVATREAVLATIAGMITSILGDDETDETDETRETGETGEAGEAQDLGFEIGMDTSLGEDLMLESIDLVALSERLADRYGERVNLAELIAGMELDELIELTVGRLVDHVLGGIEPAGER